MKGQQYICSCGALLPFGATTGCPNSNKSGILTPCHQRPVGEVIDELKEKHQSLKDQRKAMSAYVREKEGPVTQSLFDSGKWPFTE